MSEASPRPWQVIKMIGLDEDDVCVCVADAHNSSIALMVAPAENDAENAALIVAAVNERDRLRDLVKRMIPFVEKCHSDALDLSKTIKGICALKGVGTSEIDRINSEHDALIAEARAAIGEELNERKTK